VKTDESELVEIICRQIKAGLQERGGKLAMREIWNIVRKEIPQQYKDQSKDAFKLACNRILVQSQAQADGQNLFQLKTEFR
jgi:hypothetical protein